jgi:hypothetical protein
MGLLEDIVKSIAKYLTESIRRFSAFVFIVYAIGVIVGIKAVNFTPSIQGLAWQVPLLLALLSYIYTEVAVVFFLIFVAFMAILGI